MKCKSLIFSLVITFIIISFSGCGRGPAGPAGIDGTNGKDGNATVIYSPWISPPSAGWLGKSGDWYFDYSSADFTKDVVESGAVLGFVSLAGDISTGAVRPLPAFAFGSNWSFLLPNDGNTTYGKIEFITDIDNPTPASGTDYFRFIIIPANLTALKSSADLKKMSYKEVCKLYGIPE